MATLWSLAVAILVISLSTGPSSQNVISAPNQTTSSDSGSTPSLDRSAPYQGMVPTYPYDSSKRQDPSRPQQTEYHMTFQPSPEAFKSLPQPATLPTIHADYATSQPTSAQSQHQNLIINPANIQFSVPNVPDSVSKSIIEQIRTQLGSKPVTLGELNSKFISFTADIPGVMINRTMLTNVEETTLVENKNTRTTYSSPVGQAYTGSSTTYGAGGEHPSKMYTSYEPQPPIKSLSYNPAAPAYPTSAYRSPSYSEQSYAYTVPSYSSYDTSYSTAGQATPQKAPESYGEPQESYSSKPKESYTSKPAAQSNPAPSYPQPSSAYQKMQESYPKPPPEHYQPKPKEQSNYKPAETYQKPQESYQKPQESYQKPVESYQKPPESYQKPAESYPKAQESTYQKQPDSGYQNHPVYQQQSTSYKVEEPKVIYKYIEICSCPQNNEQSYQKPAESYQKPQQQYSPAKPQAQSSSTYQSSGLSSANLELGKTKGDAQGQVQEAYNELAAVYGQIHQKMDELEKLQEYAQNTQNEVGAAYQTPIQMPTFPGSVYQSQLPAVPSSYMAPTTPNYQVTYKTKSYQTQQAYKPQAQQAYQSQAQPSYQTQPKPQQAQPSYQAQSKPQQAAPSYQAQPKPQQAASSYQSQSKPQASYQTLAKPAPAPYQQPQPQSSYSAPASKPLDGNLMHVSYQKITENVISNSTKSAGYQ